MTQIIVYLILALTSQNSVNEIGFGNGGGFTGAVHAYVLLNNGNLYEENVYTDERVFIEKIDSVQLNNIFSEVKNSNLNLLTLNKPGNTYKYIYFNTSKGRNSLVWSGKSENKSLNLLYTRLMDLHKTTK